MDRKPSMTWFACAVASAGLLWGCSSDLDAERYTFACDTDADCVDGFVCSRDSAVPVCVPEGSQPDEDASQDAQDTAGDTRADIEDTVDDVAQDAQGDISADAEVDAAPDAREPEGPRIVAIYRGGKSVEDFDPEETRFDDELPSYLGSLFLQTNGEATDILVDGSSLTSPRSGFFRLPVDPSGTEVVINLQVVGDPAGDTTSYELRLRRAEEVQYIKPAASSVQEGARFGHALAQDGDTLVVSAGAYDSKDLGKELEARVHLFKPDAADTGSPSRLLTGDDPYWGNAVDVDGDHLVVGSLGGIEGGEVHVFERNATGWPSAASELLKASDEFDNPAGKQYGSAVAVSGDTVVVGAPQKPLNPAGGVELGPGEVFVYTKTSSSNTWQRQSFDRTPAEISGEAFGKRVAIDGNTVVVSATGNQEGLVGVGAETESSKASRGAVYIFERSGGVWSEEVKIKAPEARETVECVEERFAFGQSIALSGDYLAVGSPCSEGREGRVYVYKRESGLWSLDETLAAPNAGSSTNGTTGDYFGFSVSMRDRLIAVAAVGEDGSQLGVVAEDAIDKMDNGENSGAVYTFSKAPTGWNFEAYLKASNTDSGDALGRVVLGEGGLVACASREDGNDLSSPEDDSVSDAGACYRFR